MGTETFRKGCVTKLIRMVLLLAPLVALTLISGLSYSGFCFSEKRYLSNTELYERAVFDAFESVFYQSDKMTNRGQSRSWEKVGEFVRINRRCCKILHSFSDYVQSEEYRIKAGNHEGYFFPGFFGRVLGCESYLVEIRYVGSRQEGKVLERPGPRVLYRILGACGSVRRYL